MKNNTPPPNGAVTTTPTVADLMKLASGNVTQTSLAQTLGIDSSKFSRNLSSWAISHVVDLHSRLEAAKGIAGELQETKRRCNDLATKCNGLQDQLQKLQKERAGLQDELQDVASSRNAVALELQKVQDELQEMQNAATGLQQRRDEIARLEKELQDVAISLQGVKGELQSSQNALQVSQGKLQESEKVNASLKSQLEAVRLELAGAVAKVKPLEDFRKEHESWAASNVLEKFLSGGWARLLVLAMLVFYESDVTRQLLIEKGIENPVIISIGIGIAFLVFASSRNIWGQVFIVGYSLFTSGCLFGIFSFDAGYVFLLAFPCIVAAVMKNRQ